MLSRILNKVEGSDKVLNKIKRMSRLSIGRLPLTQSRHTKLYVGKPEECFVNGYIHHVTKLTKELLGRQPKFLMFEYWFSITTVDCAGWKVKNVEKWQFSEPKVHSVTHWRGRQARLGPTKPKVEVFKIWWANCFIGDSMNKSVSPSLSAVWIPKFHGGHVKLDEVNHSHITEWFGEDDFLCRRCHKLKVSKAKWFKISKSFIFYHFNPVLSHPNFKS